MEKKKQGKKKKRKERWKEGKEGENKEGRKKKKNNFPTCITVDNQSCILQAWGLTRRLVSVILPPHQGQGS